MDATRPRTGFPAGATVSAEPVADASPANRAAPALAEHASGLVARGITSVTGDLRVVRPGTAPVQVLPGSGGGQEPTASGSPDGLGARFAEISDIVATVQAASNEATAMKEAADRANKAAAGFLKEAQEWVNKAIAHAGRGRTADAEAAMAKAQEAYGKAAAQQGVADQAVAGARAATERAQAALASAQEKLAALQNEGHSRSTLASPSTLVAQAERLATAAGRAVTGAETAANAVRTTLASGTDPREVGDVVKLIAGAQAEVVAAQTAATAAASGQRNATGAAKNANSKLAFVTNALDSGGTAAADPVVAQVAGFRDAARNGAREARQKSGEATQLSASAAAKAATALDAAKALAARFVAGGKANPYASALTKAAQGAKDAAAKAQRSAALVEKGAAAAEEAADKAQASLDDANGRVQKYLDDLEARNAPRYDSGGY